MARPAASHTAGPRTAVVGGGVVGLLTAWQLRLTGHAVTVIDPDPGAAASYAAAGMLAPISEVQYGQQELWNLMTASRTEYPEFVSTLERAVSTPSGYRENGTLLVAADPGDRAAVADLVAVQQGHGMEVSPLTSSALRRQEPALRPGLAKAWSVPADHQVNPRQLIRCVTQGLNAALETSDFPDAGPPAAWVARRATRVETTRQGGLHIHYDDAATDNFSSAVLVPGLGYGQIAGVPEHHALDLRPVHGDVVRLRVRNEQLARGEEQLLSATVRARVGGRSVYLVPRGSDDPLEPRGLVIGASSREDGMVGTHTGSVAELLEDAAAVLPAVREMELVEITTRARPGTPDDRPYLGVAAGGAPVVISTGYHRHGILLAPLAARLGAALLNGDSFTDKDEQYLGACALTR
ncbi:glycine oxidase ThiO [Nesterenkonia natronophila]|uniref:glycine oxidase n=1 Tax=Nesterenkonia natronophila TaxID=2174932 RepID=A0A3A4FB34_9MICC|nr:glycine oxidase ThiO [Nesterenkonia natronophila]RJN32317.1 glycine oxidase ThiO [Nesterenkonia natronophila]